MGVGGNEPVLGQDEPFQYTGGTRLHAASGEVRGSFVCEAEDGGGFEGEVAEFAVEAGTAPSKRVLH